MTQHVLFIVTNAAVIGPHNRKTGFFFAEVAHPFDVLDKAGIAVEFASPAGGWTPYDAYDERDPAQKAFLESKAFRRLNRSRKLSEVDAADYDAILVPGGLGPMVDIQRNADVQKAIVRAWTTDKFVTAVCHGPCSLLGVDVGDGTPFVRGKKLTSFSTKEEYDYPMRQLGDALSIWSNSWPTKAAMRTADTGCYLTTPIAISLRIPCCRNPSDLSPLVLDIARRLRVRCALLDYSMTKCRIHAFVRSVATHSPVVQNRCW